MTIYLKTSVDFAIFIGNLMRVYPTMRSRIAIEIGTAFGNALGTYIILAIWNYFRHVEVLLAAMIVLAAMVLFKLAQEGLEHCRETESHTPAWILACVHFLDRVLTPLNQVFGIVLSRVMPNLSMKPVAGLSFTALLMASFRVPFILRLDDFAVYVPVFSVVNVFGFGVGVIVGHMILNLLLFISPQRTIRAVKNPLISLLGAIAFIVLGVWGIQEAVHLLSGH